MKLLGILALALSLVGAQRQTHRKFEYKHSFRGPNLAQRDGTVPFWDILGDAIASSEQLRLAPSMRSKRGAAWNKKPMIESDFFETEFSFKVTGQGRIGADGLAFWYTARQGQLGPVFGSNDHWTGLGIFFDSFDNDAQRNNPYIMMMVNDGTRSYDHQSDGSRQMITGCQKDFRNRPFPVKVKIEYLNNVLQVMIHDGMTQQDRFELCMRAENIILPKGGYFGLSAGTGGLADDHDILSFSVSSLMTEAPKPPGIIPPDEQKKFEKEFEDQWKHFEEEKEKFRKEHPDKIKQNEDDMDRFFEDSGQRDLRLIYEGQSAIHTAVQQLESKINQIMQQQTQHTHLISQVKAGGAVQTGQGQAALPAGTGANTFQRHEVDEAMTLARETSGTLREIKTYVNDMYQRVVNMETRAGQGVGSVQQAGGGGNDPYQLQSMKHYLENIKVDVEQIRNNQINQGGGGTAGCPPPTSCLTPTLFFVAIAAQSCLLIIFLLFRKNSDKAKFY